MPDSAELPLLADDIEVGLTAYMTNPNISPPASGRGAAIERILRDWLLARGYMTDMGEPPIRLDSKGVNREEVQYPGFIE